jgi:hypothetical protein
MAHCGQALPVQPTAEQNYVNQTLDSVSWAAEHLPTQQCIQPVPFTHRKHVTTCNQRALLEATLTIL